MKGILMFKWLETFKVVYETKNFSRASEILFISQPTVSSQIKQLENELNTQLFIRSGRKEVLATPQAEILYERVIDLIDDWDNLYHAVQTNQQQIIRCVIGASHTFANYILPKLLIQLHQKFPQIRFSVQMMNSLEVLQAVEQHAVDLGFIEKPLSAPTIKRASLMEDQLVLAGDTQAGPWLVRENTSGVYYYTKRFLEEKDIGDPVIEVQNNEVIVGLLKQGFGCSVISERAAEGIAYQRLDDSFKRNFYLIRRKTSTFDAIEECAKFICQWSEAQENKNNEETIE
ncbi:LysR family transcriptional regulator [Enterococcus xiangfangensis]|uniref:LysR family transcriptional regulator n=2 Tax=Enterococcus xiangfangensis TaxID=1296537 RepID=A0ABU3F893_9ENTE|nr:LysR family transcriptional regulator [Enterococcus xiangfangensis]MDT2758893.1 LysR family transcriptional regulator [Enterococcus xiangfangensis]